MTEPTTAFSPRPSTPTLGGEDAAMAPMDSMDMTGDDPSAIGNEDAEKTGGKPSLASRLGHSRFYPAPKPSKRREARRSVGARESEDDVDGQGPPVGNGEAVEDESEYLSILQDQPAPSPPPIPTQPEQLRLQVLHFQGSPIAAFSTSRIIAYFERFNAHPLGIEWIDDTSCNVVFRTRGAAFYAFQRISSAAALSLGLSAPPHHSSLSADALSPLVTPYPAHAVPLSLLTSEEREVLSAPPSQPTGAEATTLPEDVPEIYREMAEEDAKANAATRESVERLRGRLWVRYALEEHDVKASDAATRSAWYKERGRGAGRQVFRLKEGMEEDEARKLKRMRDERRRAEEERRYAQGFELNYDSGAAYGEAEGFDGRDGGAYPRFPPVPSYRGKELLRAGERDDRLEDRLADDLRSRMIDRPDVDIRRPGGRQAAMDALDEDLEDTARSRRRSRSPEGNRSNGHGRRRDGVRRRDYDNNGGKDQEDDADMVGGRGARRGRMYADDLLKLARRPPSPRARVRSLSSRILDANGRPVSTSILSRLDPSSSAVEQGDPTSLLSRFGRGGEDEDVGEEGRVMTVQELEERYGQ